MRSKDFNLIVLLLIGIGLMPSCQKDKFIYNAMSDTAIPNGNNHCKQIIIDQSQYDSAPIDDYTINDVNIENDSLKLTVQYGGGCGTTNFELLTTGFFMESNPVQLNILLSFKDDDPCEALIQEQICFDLSELTNLYNDSYRTNKGTIILWLQDYTDQLIYVF